MSEPWNDLRSSREALGWTQRDVARDIVSQSHYSLIEQGVLVPSDRVARHLAARLRLQVDRWGEEWVPYRRAFHARQRCWRSFARDGFVSSEQLRALSHPSLHVDFECYAQYLDASTACPEVAYRRLADARRQLCSSRATHVPQRMRQWGDIRLRIVLAMVESQLQKRLHRYQAATAWALCANRMMCEVPAFWH
ncbi:helix-turn-helix domain-containing protein [Alicyclobacillus fastidiosus]|uniref:Helix-turn-helix transcriptional regulator n=1 Tax=Alicyclobacillus fastidiosus TaxID=392011 RepID=A0ABV5ADB4_9BACL|nr:helix-turn-helix transcriptional regulator [Alicyclobacillus fastidiosus]WEH10400.1 helix-turn-helix transcriptional regulator [Alicyclobacillus fastidiosus]